METKESKTLQKWQLDIIKRLPTSTLMKEKILKEEYGVDWNGNTLIKEREVVTIQRKKSKRKIDPTQIKDILEDSEKLDTDIVLHDA
jgi:hypothetical protein